MLLVEVYVPRGVLSAKQRRELSGQLVTAIMRSAGPPTKKEDSIDRGRSFSQAVVQEIDAWSVGEHPVDQTNGGRYIVRVTLPAGHLNDPMRAEINKRITNVFVAIDAEPERLLSEPRLWIYLTEVPDGNMGGFGRVLRLADLMNLVLRPEDASAADRVGGSADTNTEIDPVCEMPVTLTDMTITFEHDGRTYAFCCSGCRDMFVAQLAEPAT